MVTIGNYSFFYTKIIRQIRRGFRILKTINRLLSLLTYTNRRSVVRAPQGATDLQIFDASFK